MTEFFDRHLSSHFPSAQASDLAAALVVVKHDDVARLMSFIARGLDVNARTADGGTLLIAATKANGQKCRKLLTALCADADIKDMHGNTAQTLSQAAALNGKNIP